MQGCVAPATAVSRIVLPLLQVCKLIYVDNSHVVAQLLKEIFPDAEVKEDLYHVQARMGDALHDAHPCKRE